VAIAKEAQAFMTTFPDMVVTFDKLETRGERTAFHWTLTGTNTGPGGTGKRVRISGYELWKIDNDRLIAESRGYFDPADYERQLKL
jgi:predicted ester cyclase